MSHPAEQMNTAELLQYAQEALGDFSAWMDQYVENEDADEEDIPEYERLIDIGQKLGTALFFLQQKLS
jgi:hypothetical protein